MEQENNQQVVSKSETNPPKKSGGKLKYILNISFVLILTVVALVVTLWGDNFNNVVNLFKKCDWRFVAAVFGIMLASILIRALILFCFARLYVKNYHFHQALAVEQIGVFYNAVTPGSTGGQFMEAYTYKKQGVPVSSAVSMIAMCSIIYQIVLIFYGLFSFIIKYNFINEIGAINIKIAEISFDIPIWLLTIIGFILNVSVVGLILLMSYWRGFHNFIMGPCIGLLHKIRIMKNPDKTRENLRVSVENFKIELKRLFANIPFTILVSVLFFGFFTLRFCIPYFCGLALGNQSTNANFWDAVFLGNYHQMVTGLIPIPGSAGISEYFFVKLFCSTENAMGFYAVIDSAGKIDVSQSQTLTTGSLLLWRTMTFTLPLIVAGLVSAFYRSSPKEVVEDQDTLPSHNTFVSLQKETYVERYKEYENVLQTNALSKAAIKAKLKSLSKPKKNNNVIKHTSSIDKYDEITIEDKEEKPKK